MYYVYIIKSINYNRYYIGHTENIDKRIKLHNNGRVKSTKSFIPWKLIYREVYNTRREAYKRELLIKSYKHGEAFKKLINN